MKMRQRRHRIAAIKRRALARLLCVEKSGDTMAAAYAFINLKKVWGIK